MVSSSSTRGSQPSARAGAGLAAVRREVDEALARGDFVRPDDRVIAVMSVLGALLGLPVLAIVLAQG